MEKYAISVMGREMYFLYINKLHRENTWLQPVNFGYYKINFFILFIYFKLIFYSTYFKI